MQSLLAEARACTACAADLELGPRPVLQAGATARLLIISQAPGRAVHLSGIPWNDPSGDRLREWTGLDRGTFYDPGITALIPMGLCYPGRIPGGGDRPPCAECAPRWHPRLLAAMPDVRLTLLVGSYAQGRYLAGDRRTLTARVADPTGLPPGIVALPHPSWRSTGWMTRNPWFETANLPALRARIAQALA